MTFFDKKLEVVTFKYTNTFFTYKSCVLQNPFNYQIICIQLNTKYDTHIFARPQTIWWNFDHPTCTLCSNQIDKYTFEPNTYFTNANWVSWKSICSFVKVKYISNILQNKLVNSQFFNIFCNYLVNLVIPRAPLCSNGSN